MMDFRAAGPDRASGIHCHRLRKVFPPSVSPITINTFRFAIAFRSLLYRRCYREATTTPAQSGRGLIRLPAGEQHPGDAGIAVGQGHGGDIAMAPRAQLP